MRTNALAIGGLVMQNSRENELKKRISAGGVASAVG